MLRVSGHDHNAAEKELPELEEILKKARVGEIDLDDVPTRDKYGHEVYLLLQTLRYSLFRSIRSETTEDEYLRVMNAHHEAIELIGDALRGDVGAALGRMVKFTKESGRLDLHTALPHYIQAYEQRPQDVLAAAANDQPR